MGSIVGGFGRVMGMLLQIQHTTCTVGTSQGCAVLINPFVTLTG